MPDEVMYRPPFEARSFLLEVTKGCSHNRCSFCTMYRDVPFRMLPVEVIEQNINDAVPYASYITRVFLENGDPFVLSADKLIEIAEMIHKHLPKVETIAMYTTRHSFATRCVELGMDVKCLSEILGHSSVTITLNRYVHPTMAHKAENMNKLSGLF